MKRIFVLLKGDIKNAIRDKMLLFILFSPLIIAIAFKFLIPFLEKILMNQLSLSLTPYYFIIMIFILVLIPSILGMLIALLIIEDRDQGIINYLSITPVQRFEYLINKLLVSMILSFFSLLFVIYFLNLVDIKLLRSLPIFIMASLETAVIALFITAFASNKMEAFAFSKASGIFFITPIAAYFIESRWAYLLAIFPTFWIYKSFEGVYGGFSMYIVRFILGFVVHLIFILFLYRKFKERID
ncbi:MAG: hypothetical protein ACOCRO_06305 [Halanaerobiales bacterium]